jgi:hypothetical protein
LNSDEEELSTGQTPIRCAGFVDGSTLGFSRAATHQAVRAL